MQTQYKHAAIEACLKAKGLNPPQIEAVCAVNGPVIVLAGAGSGKTTTIVNRIAFMMQFGNAYHGDRPLTEADAQFVRQMAQGECEPDADALAARIADHPIPGWQILAITFTNKAANELQTRLAAMLGESAKEIWAATFHSACVRILRRYIDRLGYQNHFTIYDADDSLRAIKACYTDPRCIDPVSKRPISDKTFPPKAVAHAIGRAKDRLLSPEAYLEDSEGDYQAAAIARIYAIYQERLQASNAVDFDDIIGLTVRLFQEHPDVLEYYQNRCRYLLVDEYQDTNPAQYELIRLLAQSHHNLCVVGDDDQSIYRFRGATVENILSFEKQFPDSRVIRLEQNYRSTGHILNAANSVIRHNNGRMTKTLWTAAGDGEKVHWYRASDSKDEAAFIASTMQRLQANGTSYRDMAVLYRTHALSNTLEMQLRHQGIPYRIYGGLRFYDRKEVKDVLAYLAVLNNPFDTLRFARIINEPKRGIGAQTLNDILSISNDLHMSPLAVLRSADTFPRLSRKAAALKAAAEQFDTLTAMIDTVPLDELYDHVIHDTGYVDMLKALGDEGITRLENIAELKSSILTYMESADEPTLDGFMEEIALYTDQDRANETDDAVTLMTVHAAKGLEYHTVFLLGMDESIFPHSRSGSDPKELEEERRLAYVAITRAKRQLYAVSAEFRVLYGSMGNFEPSRFLKEMDPETVALLGSPKAASMTATMGASVSRRPVTPMANSALAAKAKTSQSASPLEQFSVGDRVRHAMFGEGIVLTAEPMGNDCMLEVAFDRVGTKKIMAKFTKLRKVMS